MFVNDKQTMPLNAILTMNRDIKNHLFYFSYFKLRAAFSYNAGNIMHNDLDDLCVVLSRKKRTVKVHLDKLVELGYLRKTDFGWQIVSSSKVGISVWGKKSNFAQYSLSELMSWSLTEFKSFLSNCHMLEWDQIRKQWEFRKLNNIKGYEKGRPYDYNDRFISRKRLKKPSANLTSRDVSLSLTATVTGISKTTAHRRLKSSPFKNQLFIESKRSLVSNIDINTGMHLHQVLTQEGNNKYTKDLIEGVMKSIRGVEFKAAKSGRYTVSSDFSKLFYQPSTTMRTDTGLIARKLVDNKRTLYPRLSIVR